MLELAGPGRRQVRTSGYLHLRVLHHLSQAQEMVGRHQNVVVQKQQDRRSCSGDETVPGCTYGLAG
jgi:hypothetical protein